MTEPGATVHDYAGLVAALRARKDELGISDATLDDLAGFQSGYTGKLLGPAQSKKLGGMSLGVMLDALGLTLRMESDAGKLARVQHRFSKRAENHVRKRVMLTVQKVDGAHRMTRATLCRLIGALGAKGYLAKVPPRQRRKHARNAARARWRRAREKREARDAKASSHTGST